MYAGELQISILEKEDAGHKDEAVKLLIDKVLEEQEWGLNLFLLALRGDGDGSGVLVSFVLRSCF